MASLIVLKVGLLGLWAAWFSLVFATNIFDALRMMGILPQRWRFASENYERLRDAVAVYRESDRLAALLYGGVIVWQLITAVLLWRAFAASVSVQQVASAPVNLAFTSALALWAAFLLAEEIFKQYRTEGKHLLFFTAQLLTLGALHLLPD